jgi:hypothetical protein
MRRMAWKPIGSGATLLEKFNVLISEIIVFRAGTFSG